MNRKFTKLFDKRNSLLFWFPKIQKLGIPLPVTKWVKLERELGRRLVSEESEQVEKEFQPILRRIEKIAEDIGYPVFIRTDMASNKHGWKTSAFVRRKDQLRERIIRTLEHNEMAGFLGLNYSAIVIREFLELDWRFKAFHGEMPVARERRYFVQDGKVLCHHPYWIKDGILQAHRDDGKKLFFSESHSVYRPHNLPNKWEEMLFELNLETKEEVRTLTRYCEQISSVIKGYWSVDFAYTRDGKWFLIDMALGEASYHPENCPLYQERREKE